MIFTKQDILVLFVANSILVFMMMGVVTFLSGFMAKSIDHDAASDMLAYIQQNNPIYYEQLTSSDDISYRREFFSHYTKTGNGDLKAAGMIMMFIALNSGIAFSYIVYRNYRPVLAEKIPFMNDEDAVDLGGEHEHDEEQDGDQPEDDEESF